MRLQINLNMVDDYRNIFSNPINLTIGQGIGSNHYWISRGKFDYITELTYLEIFRSYGLFFGFIRGYFICVLLFSAANIVYNYNKWPIKLKSSYTFPYIEKGSNYLIKEFPNEKKYQDSKEKIEEL